MDSVAGGVLGLGLVAFVVIAIAAMAAQTTMENVSEMREAVLRGNEIALRLQVHGWKATQAPPLEQVRLRPHAVERHGEQALTARERVFNCPVEDLRAKICPAGEKYGMRVHFWCESGSQLCAGMITTIGGVEKTSFIKPCSYWARCHP